MLKAGSSNRFGCTTFKPGFDSLSGNCVWTRLREIIFLGSRLNRR